MIVVDQENQAFIQTLSVGSPSLMEKVRFHSRKKARGFAAGFPQDWLFFSPQTYDHYGSVQGAWQAARLYAWMCFNVRPILLSAYGVLSAKNAVCCC